jgi:hypothetical protein
MLILDDVLLSVLRHMHFVSQDVVLCHPSDVSGAAVHVSVCLSVILFV